MMSQRISKPKTQRGKKFLLNREAKLEENVKKVMLIRGGKTSETVTQLIKDIHSIKKPNAVMFHKKNILRPFEDQTSLEFFSQRNDTSLMLFGSHSKKRPHNLVFGTFYDSHMLDMFELGIEKYKPISDFKNGKVIAGIKPCILFAGDEFENDIVYKRLKSLLTDFWRGEKVSNVCLQGLEHIIQITAVDGKLFLRNYRTLLKKSGFKTPRVELEEIGPAVDFVLRRNHLAAESLYKDALKQPKALKPTKKKNIDHDVFGTKTGRIHMQTQDLSSLQTRKMKGLKRGKFSDPNSKNDEVKSKRTKSG